MKIKTKDEIVRTVLKKMDERSLVGQKKYGATMMGEIKNEVKDLRRFLVDVQEELMDALLYIESAKFCLQEEIEECYINDKFENVDLGVMYDEKAEERMEIIGRNGNTGEHYWTEDATTDQLTYISNKLSDYPG